MSAKTYQRIVSSSSVIGGAEGCNVLLGIVRIKFVAVLLGPVGLALLGNFQVIQSLVSTLTGLGINNSGVRDVAEASGADDKERIARTATTLRRMCWLTGILGAATMSAFAEPLSRLTFETSDYAGQITLLGVAVLLGSVAAGQRALVQGMRRIGDLARMNIMSTMTGTAVAIGFYYYMGLNGIVPALVTMAAIALAASLWCSRGIKIPRVAVTWRESMVAAGSLVTLGLAFMWTGLLGVGVEYVTRTLIQHEINLAAVGIFGAAFRLAGIFLNFILNAMAADFYPSLTGAAEDHAKMRDLVNKQTEIGLLLAMPGLIAALALAPWIIQLFYTDAFAQSAGMLQWFILGSLGRVVSWPMGFIMLAKGAGRLFAVAQTIVQCVHVAAIWLGLKWFGLEGVAMAFCFLYIFNIACVMIISRRLINFKWSSSACRLLLVLLPVAVTTMVLSRYMPLIPASVIGSMIAILVGVFCLRGLCFRLGNEHCLVSKLCLIPGLRQILYAGRNAG